MDSPQKRPPSIFDVIVVGLFAAHATLRTLVLVFLPTTIVAIASHLAQGRHEAIGTVLGTLTAFVLTTSLSAAAYVLRRGPGQGSVTATDAFANELSAPAVPLVSCALLLLGEVLRIDTTLLGTLPALPFFLLGLLVAVLAPSEGLGALTAIRRSAQLLAAAPLRFVATLGAAYLATGALLAVPVGFLLILGLPVLLTLSGLLIFAGPMFAGVLFAATQHLRAIDAARRRGPQGLSRHAQP